MNAPAENPRSSASNCATCRSIRLTVKHNVDQKPILLHVTKDENFQSILFRLCQDYTAIWKTDIVYYFYIEIGGLYHSIDDPQWLRGTKIKMSIFMYSLLTILL